MRVCPTSLDVSTAIPDDLVTGWGLFQMYGRQADRGEQGIAVLPQRTLPERLASLLLDLNAASDVDGLI